MRDTGKYGRGIYATREIKNGELIEESPVFLSPKSERKYLKKTVIFEYCFNWEERQTAIALGYGSLFNHSYTPNAKFVYNYDYLSISFYAIRDIKKGEEITINYNGDPDDRSPLWFEVIE